MKSVFPRNPVFLALLAVFLLLPFAQVKAVFFGVPLYLPEIALYLAFLFAFGRFFIQHPPLLGKVCPGDRVFLGGTLLFLLGAILSFISNPLSLTGLGMLKSWFLFPILGAWLVCYEARSPVKRIWFILAWFVSLVATAIGSLFFWEFGVMTYDYRLSALYPSPNFLAVFLAPGIFLAWYLILLCREKCHHKLLFQTLLLSGTFIILLSIYQTRSYGAWAGILIAFSATVLGQWYLFRRTKTLVLTFALLFLVGAGMSVSEYGSEKWQALASFEERSSFSSRLMIWQAAGKILEEHWIFGIGLGRFQVMYLEYQRYFPPYLEWAVPEPHNWYLAIVLGTGTVGFIGFVIVVGRFLFLQCAIVFLDRQKEKRLFALITTSIVIFYLAYGLTDTPYFKNDLALSFWLLIGLGLAALFEASHSSPPEKSRSL